VPNVELELEEDGDEAANIPAKTQKLECMERT
jgi:hypothetical protein